MIVDYKAQARDLYARLANRWHLVRREESRGDEMDKAMKMLRECFPEVDFSDIRPKDGAAYTG